MTTTPAIAPAGDGDTDIVSLLRDRGFADAAHVVAERLSLREGQKMLVSVAVGRESDDLYAATATASTFTPVAPEGGEPSLPWQSIDQCPDSDDLYWFLRGDTIDGPRMPASDDVDYWDWFAPCEAPPTAALNAAPQDGEADQPVGDGPDEEESCFALGMEACAMYPGCRCGPSYPAQEAAR